MMNSGKTRKKLPAGLSQHHSIDNSH
jgi:hypothetical protein